MSRTARNALLAVAGCMLLTACGATRTTNNTTNTNPAAASAAPTPAAPGGAAAGALTACQLITEQDASTAIGSLAGPGTSGGSAALSECIYDDGTLIVSMKTDAKDQYDTSHATAAGKGATNLTGVGDSAFEAGTAENCTLFLLKGTTLVSIILNGPDAQNVAVTVAKVAAAKL